MVKTVFQSAEPCTVQVSPASMRLYIYKDTKSLSRRAHQIIDVDIGSILIQDESRRIATFSGSEEYNGTVYDVIEIRLTDKDEWDHQDVILIIKGYRQV